MTRTERKVKSKRQSSRKISFICKRFYPTVVFGFGSDPIDLQFATSLIFTESSICNLTFCPTSGLFGNFQTLGIISRINLFGPRGFVCFVLEPPIQLIRLNFSTCQTELDTFQNQLPPCTTRLLMMMMTMMMTMMLISSSSPVYFSPSWSWLPNWSKIFINLGAHAGQNQWRRPDMLISHCPHQKYSRVRIKGKLGKKRGFLCRYNYRRIGC